MSNVTGAETAQKMYGARGWALHHNTDIWRTTGAVDNGTVGYRVHVTHGSALTFGSVISSLATRHILQRSIL